MSMMILAEYNDDVWVWESCIIMMIYEHNEYNVFIQYNTMMMYEFDEVVW